MSEYNGYTNRETWLVCLWIDNDKGLYDLTRELVAESSGNEYEQAEALQNYFIDEAADATNGLFSDLLQNALNSVNWDEVLNNIKEV